MTELTDSVRSLLHEAAETHHVVYRITDGTDDDWASWYADWLTRLSELPDLLARSPVRSELTHQLVSLDTEYTAAGPPEQPWEDFFAERLIQVFAETSGYHERGQVAFQSRHGATCVLPWAGTAGTALGMMGGMSRLQAPRVVVVDAALADGRSAQVRGGVTLLVDGATVEALWFEGEGPDPARLDAVVIDGSGSTIVPGMVDSHAHLSMPGGARWIERGFDPSEELLAVGEDNGELMVRAGIRWARDVGAPRRTDADGRERALSLVLRDRWVGAHDRPYVRAAGTWISRGGSLPHGLAVEVEHGADLAPAVARQLDDGADLVKLYLDGPDADTAPFTVAEVGAAVRLAHERGATVAAHCSVLAGARVGAEAGVDSIEHGFALDADAAATMAEHDVTLVSTLAVLHSWQSFRTTSGVERFAAADAVVRLGQRLEQAQQSIVLAHRAGVAIAAGSDFGGGSLRANQLAWEVQALVCAGIEPQVALAAATWRGGDLLGDQTAGRVAVGGPAHFSLVHGDPLVDSSALWRIWLTR